MSILPIPGKQFFIDFEMFLENFTINRNSKKVTSVKGMSETDEHGDFFYLPIDTDVLVNDVLISDSNDEYKVDVIRYESYNGKPDIIKAYY